MNGYKIIYPFYSVGLSTYQLRLSRFRSTPSIGWCRVFLLIHSMCKLKRKIAQTHLRVLRLIPVNQYRRYRQIFRLAVHVQSLGLCLSRITLLIGYLAVMLVVSEHPEWNVPLYGVALTNLLFQLLVYIAFQITISVMMVFYFNATFVRMLLDSIANRLAFKQQSDDRLAFAKLIVATFDETLLLLRDINHLWKHLLCNYYLCFLPALMTVLYLILFERLNALFYGILVYGLMILGFSIHFNSWIASHVRTTGKHNYRQLYHSKLVYSTCLNASTKIHVIFSLYISRTTELLDGWRTRNGAYILYRHTLAFPLKNIKRKLEGSR